MRLENQTLSPSLNFSLSVIKLEDREKVRSGSLGSRAMLRKATDHLIYCTYSLLVRLGKKKTSAGGL